MPFHLWRSLSFHMNDGEPKFALAFFPGVARLANSFSQEETIKLRRARVTINPAKRYASMGAGSHF